MKFFLIPLIILSIFVIPAAFAESAPYILVQIIHRDSDGNLLTYLQRYDESANLKGPQLINIFKGLGLEIERIELRFQPQTLTFQTSV